MKSASEQAQEIKELSIEEKQALLDKAMQQEKAHAEEESNISIYNMAELAPFLKELTPMEMFEKSVAMNYTTAANLQYILPQLSKKNLIKLFFATLKLPEKDSSINFGGSQDDKKNCEIAYAQAQLMRNSLVHVLGTSSIAKARFERMKKEEESKQESQGGDNE